MDLLLAVVRRTRAGRNPFAPDKQHLHHRLLQMGHSHRRAVTLMYAWTALVAGTAVAVAFVPWPYALGGFAAGLALMVWLVRRPGVDSAHRDAGRQDAQVRHLRDLGRTDADSSAG